MVKRGWERALAERLRAEVEAVKVPECPDFRGALPRSGPVAEGGRPFAAGSPYPPVSGSGRPRSGFSRTLPGRQERRAQAAGMAAAAILALVCFLGPEQVPGQAALAGGLESLAADAGLRRDLPAFLESALRRLGESIAKE